MSVYWSFYFLAWALIGALFHFRARTAGVPTAVWLDTILFSLPLSLVCTHLAFALSFPEQLWDWRRFFLTVEGWRTGHTSFGAVLGVIVAILAVSAIHRFPVAALTDCLAPTMFVAIATMRVGCFLAGCCYGGPTQMPWGVRFASSDPFPSLTPPSHPTQLYEVLLSLLILAMLPSLFRAFKAASTSGLPTWICLLLYFSQRFVLEFFRIGGTSEVLFAGFSMTQYGTALGGGIALIMILRAQNAVSENPSADRANLRQSPT